MSAGFTPGPWGYQEHSDAYTHIVRAGDGSLGGGRFICQLGQDTSGVSEANARLIAAAPELYEAAILALNYIENTEGEFDFELDVGIALRAALAKARGEQVHSDPLPKEVGR